MCLGNLVECSVEEDFIWSAYERSDQGPWLGGDLATEDEQEDDSALHCGMCDKTFDTVALKTRHDMYFHDP